MSAASPATPLFMRAAPLCRALGISRNLFYRRLRSRLTPMIIGTSKWYSVAEAVALIQGVGHD